MWLWEGERDHHSYLFFKLKYFWKQIYRIFFNAYKTTWRWPSTWRGIARTHSTGSNIAFLVGAQRQDLLVDALWFDINILSWLVKSIELLLIANQDFQEGTATYEIPVSQITDVQMIKSVNRPIFFPIESTE